MMVTILSWKFYDVGDIIKILVTYFRYIGDSCIPQNQYTKFLVGHQHRCDLNKDVLFISSCWYVGWATTISDLRTSDCNRFIFSISSGVFSFSEDDPSLSDLSELSDFPRPLSEALPKPESHSLKKISGMSQIGSAIFGPWISGRLGSGLDMGKKIFTCEYFLRKQQNCHPIHALAFYFYTFWASQRLIYHLKNNIR